MKNLWEFFIKYFNFQKKDDFEYKGIKIIMLKNKDLLIIPEHWIRELFLVPEERELKIAFSQNEKPITIFFSKDIPKEKELKEDEIKLPIEDFIIHKFFRLKTVEKLTNKVFRYDHFEEVFTPCQ